LLLLGVLVFFDASGQVKDASDDPDAAELSETRSVIADSIEVRPGAVIVYDDKSNEVKF
jgi:hypothetical protein